MAEEIIEKFAIEPELVKSSGGAFEVSLDGNLLFSKKALGRHAEEGEIMKILASRL